MEITGLSVIGLLDDPRTIINMNNCPPLVVRLREIGRAGAMSRGTPLQLIRILLRRLSDLQFLLYYDVVIMQKLLSNRQC